MGIVNAQQQIIFGGIKLLINMKNLTSALALLISLSISFQLQSQEVDIDVSSGTNAVINMEPNPANGNNIINMLDTGSFSKGQWRIIFDKNELPPPMGPIERAWEVGNGNGFGVNNRFFTISRYDFILDFIASRPAMVINEQNLFTGLGEIDPKAQLHVNFTDQINDGVNSPTLVVGRHGSLNSSYGYLTVDQPTADRMSNIARFRDNGATQVEINRNANTYQLEVFGDAFASGGMWVNSDRTLKRNIQKLNQGLQGLRKLKPSTYKYKTADPQNVHLPEELQFGLIAQELKKVYPNLVRKSEGPREMNETEGSTNSSVLSVNYNGLIPVLISSVQELDELSQSRADEVTALKLENEGLKARIEKLEKAMVRLLEK